MTAMPGSCFNGRMTTTTNLHITTWGDTIYGKAETDARITAADVDAVILAMEDAAREYDEMDDRSGSDKGYLDGADVIQAILDTEYVSIQAADGDLDIVRSVHQASLAMIEAVITEPVR